MAWLLKKKRTNPESGKKEIYFRIGWRDARGIPQTRAIGFVPEKEARRLLMVFEGKLAAGEEVQPPATEPSSTDRSEAGKVTAWTLKAYLTERFLPVVKRDKAPKSYISARCSANALIARLGETPLAAITYQIVDDYVTARKAEGRRSRTLILELRCLRQALLHAVDSGALLASPKLPSIADRDRQPHRFLTVEESERLLEALRPFDEQPHKVTRGKPPIQRDSLTYLAVLMALNLGLRLNEILSRGWEDLRWSLGPYGALVICAKPEIGFQVKVRRDRTVPLTPELHTELHTLHQRLDRPSRGWIFPSPADPESPRREFHHALKRACVRAGLPPIHPHGLRHTWATRLAMAGVDRRTLMELGGWKEGRMLDEIYAHTTDAHMADVMSRMGITASGTRRS